MTTLEEAKTKIQEADQLRADLAALVLDAGQPQMIEGSFATIESEPHPLAGQRVIARTYTSGVSIGILQTVTTSDAGFEVHLTDAIRLWRWTGAFTLSEVATKGSKTARIAKHPTEGVFMSDRGLELLAISDEAFARVMAGAVEGVQ